MFKQERAIKNFKDTVQTFNRSSMTLIGSAAVCFIIGAFDEKNKRDYADTMADLKEIVTEEGLKMAQMYKYIGLARQLVVHLVKKFPLNDGIIHDVLDARSPGNATSVITDYLSGEEVQTLDKLGGFLGGRYQRSADAPDGRSPRTPTGDGDDAGEDTSNGRNTRNRLTVTTTPQEVAQAIDASEEIAVTVATAVFEVDTFTKLVSEINDIELIDQMSLILDERKAELAASAKVRRRTTSKRNGRSEHRAAA